MHSVHIAILVITRPWRSVRVLAGLAGFQEGFLPLHWWIIHLESLELNLKCLTLFMLSLI